MGIIHKYVRDGSRTIVLAIDDPRLGMEEIVRIISSISEYTKVFKLGLPLIVHYGLRNISKLTNEFSDLYFIADLKLADIGSVMKLAVNEVYNAGFKGVTAHAIVGFNGALDDIINECRNFKLDLILQLSMTNSGSITTIDRLLAELKKIVSVVDPEGLIIAANKHEIIRDVRSSLGWRYVILSPGIMISGVHPGEALCNGADAEIAGRLILSSPNPKKALLDIISMQKEFLESHSKECIRK